MKSTYVSRAYSHTTPFFDHGTPELQEKRRALVGEGPPYALPLAESLLGVLYAHQVIEAPHYEAGFRFRKLRSRYQFCLGSFLSKRSHALFFRVDQGRGVSLHGLPELEEVKRKNAWQKAVRVLEKAGPQPYQMVMKVVFHDGMPQGKLRYAKRQIEALRDGLGCLDLYFTQGLQGGRDTPCDLVLVPDPTTMFPPLLKTDRPGGPQGHRARGHLLH